MTHFWSNSLGLDLLINLNNLILVIALLTWQSWRWCNLLMGPQISCCVFSTLKKNINLDELRLILQIYVENDVEIGRQKSFN